MQRQHEITHSLLWNHYVAYRTCVELIQKKYPTWEYEEEKDILNRLTERCNQIPKFKERIDDWNNEKLIINEQK